MFHLRPVIMLPTDILGRRKVYGAIMLERLLACAGFLCFNISAKYP